MVVLPTPARAATASIDRPEMVMPSASRSSAASMIAWSTLALRGRPGGRVAVAVVDITSNIVTDTSRFDEYLFGDALADRGVPGLARALGGLGPAGQVDRHQHRADQADHQRAGGGPV